MFVRASELLHSRMNERFPHRVPVVVIPGNVSDPHVQRHKAEITEWARAHATDSYSHFLENDGTMVYVFASQQDAFAFKIRWG